jgi:glycosyltransferase involved in cell wall biosynthesis
MLDVMPARDPGRPRVVILRGHQANPWELAPWAEPALADRYAVSYLRSRRGWFDTSSLSLESSPAWTLRSLVPPGRLGDLAVRVPGDRYLGLRSALRGAAIVHSQELGYWYSMQAARLRARLPFKLVLTVWETIPLLDAYRNVRTRAYRRVTLPATDLFLAATERARESLLLEGAPPERIRVCPPGIAIDRFAGAGDVAGATTILSPGRLVWEKGHQDVLRAVALLRREAEPAAAEARVWIVGTGPDEARLRAHADDLGIADSVEFRGFVPYDEMPSLYARAACVVLASLPVWSWEEQFGMVLAEAMAAGRPILASSSGAIPEVAGACAEYFAPGDWQTLARLLARTLRSGGGSGAAPERARAFSTEAAAGRIADAYAELLAGA